MKFLACRVGKGKRKNGLRDSNRTLGSSHLLTAINPPSCDPSGDLVLEKSPLGLVLLPSSFGRFLFIARNDFV